MSKSKSTVVAETANGTPVNRIAEKKAKDTVVIGNHIEIPAPKVAVVKLEIEGISPLVVCNWSDKALRMIREKQTRTVKSAPREPKDPVSDYRSAFYLSEEGEWKGEGAEAKWTGWTGIPACGFKGALVNACRAVDNLPMTVAKRVLYVYPDGVSKRGQDLIRIYGDYEMNESPVRIDNGGTADLRYRPMYKKWRMKLAIEYLENMLTDQQVANLVQLAGRFEGLCEWRPGAPKSTTGHQGRFKIVES
jgi:hypothetical protein